MRPANTEGPTKNTYIAIDKAPEHPLTAGFEGAQRIIGGTRRVPVELTTALADVPFRFIPHFPDLPMEEIYAREPADMPAAVTRQLPGGGRVVYFPWNIGEIFWEVMNLDHSILIENAVRWALDDRPRVEVEGFGIVDIATRSDDRGKLSVHLVNLTNPMMMKGPIREFIPLAGQMVSVALPGKGWQRRQRCGCWYRSLAAEVRIGGRARRSPSRRPSSPTRWS